MAGNILSNLVSSVSSRVMHHDAGANHHDTGTMDGGTLPHADQGTGKPHAGTGEEAGISENIVKGGEKAAKLMERARGLLGKIKLPAFAKDLKEKLTTPGEEGSKLAGVKDKGLMVGGGVLAADGARRMMKKDADGKRHVLKGAVEAAAGAGLVAAGIAVKNASKAQGEGADAQPGKFVAMVQAQRNKGTGGPGVDR